MSWIDRKYISLISSHVKNFKWNSGGMAKCSCPICGDSKKDRNRTRFYFLHKNNNYTVFCHNCGVSMSFSKFLETMNSELYFEYIKESLFEKNISAPTQEIEFKESKPIIFASNALKSLKKISQLEHNHICKKYVEDRMIPSNTHYRLYYTPYFNSWVESIYPGKFDEKTIKMIEPRLVIPFLDKEGNLFGFQGRAIKPSKQRYITIMLKDTEKMFGMDKVDLNKKFYITEGPIDSLFLPNAISMAGSSINLEYNKNAVFIFDNEPRNKEIVQKIHKSIQNKFGVVIWPKTMKCKDINDIVLTGVTIPDIVDIIDKNTYYGFEAQMKFNEWKKV